MIELIMVITLIGVLSFYASSRLEVNTFDERYFADDLVSAFRYAQKFSIATGCQVQVVIDPTPAGTPPVAFSLKSDASCGTANAVALSQNVLRPWAATAFVNQAKVPANLSYLVSQTNPTVVEASLATNKSVTFYPQGWACAADGSSSATQIIKVVGVSTTRSIHVECSTGFVYITT